MIKVLFVCLGNICRSPLAEAIFNHKIKTLDLQNKFLVDSCGTGDYHIGQQPDPRTIQSAYNHDIPINHACRQLTKNDLVEFDFILAMDENNLRNILRLADDLQKKKIHLMRTFDSSDNYNEVPDPYHGTTKDFEEVYKILDRSLDGFLASLKGE